MHKSHSSHRPLLLTLALLACALALAACVAPPKAPAPTPATAAAAKADMPSADQLFTKLWSLPGSFDRVTHVTLLGDTLYIVGTPRGMVAVNTATGIKRWVHIGRRCIDHPPTLRREALYLLEGGLFVVLDKNSGDELSRAKSRTGSVTPVYPGANTLMIAGGGDYIYGIHPETGYRAWREKVDDYIIKSIWDGEDLAYMISTRGTIYAISAATHMITWRHTFPRPATGIPVLANETIYIGSDDFHFYAIDAASGIVKHRVSLGAPVTGTPLVAHGVAYVATTEKILFALDLDKRKIIGTLKNVERVLTATKSTLVTLRKQGPLNVLGLVDVSAGNRIGEVTARRYLHFAAHPETGVLYAVTATGDVLALAAIQPPAPE